LCETPGGPVSGAVCRVHVSSAVNKSRYAP
jgi:hypothetical protein